MSNSTCDLGDYLETPKKVLPFVAANVLTPVYFSVGVFSRISFLIAFYKQYEKEKGYAYQLFVSITDLLLILTYSLNMTTLNNLSGFRLPGPHWFRESYALMWYSAHLATPLFQIFTTMSLLLSVIMASNQVFALAKPFTYKNLNHRKYLLIALGTSFSIGFSTSVFDMFRYQVGQVGNEYEVIVNDAFVATTAAFALAMVRNIVRMLGQCGSDWREYRDGLVLPVEYEENGNHQR